MFLSELRRVLRFVLKMTGKNSIMNQSSRWSFSFTTEWRYNLPLLTNFLKSIIFEVTLLRRQPPLLFPASAQGFETPVEVSLTSQYELFTLQR